MTYWFFLQIGQATVLPLVPTLDRLPKSRLHSLDKPFTERCNRMGD
jgi:hypothetical protein